MEKAEQGQVNRSAADIYAEFFVPALFAEWAPRVSHAAGLARGQHVLDVACGTGVLARQAARQVGAEGRVVGLDRNDGMLEVARRSDSGIEWQFGMAEALPFPDAHFDAVVSQFGLMFFDDRTKALAEMWRVLRPGGCMAVAVWDALDNNPGYAAMTSLLHNLFGEETANALRAPYCLGDPHLVQSLYESAGIDSAKIATHDGTARFPSIQSWVHTDVKGWTLADLIDDAQYRLLLERAQSEMQGFVQSDGTVQFRHPAHITVARKL